MTRKELEELIALVESGKATESEKVQLEKIADRLSDPSQEPFRSEIHKRAIHSELRKRVAALPSQQSMPWARIAATVAVLISISVGAWLGYNSLNSAQIIVQTTRPAEQRTITLSDGTMIDLNGASTIRYAETFDSDERVVTIDGEAFFRVAKDAKRPFTVNALGTKTTVLGTEFNVSAFAEDSSVIVSLTEGSVQIEALNETHVLKPMQQAQIELDAGSVQRLDFDSTDASIAWLSGDVVLERMTLNQFARFAKRNYNTEIQFESQNIGESTVSGRFKQPSIDLLIASIASAKNLDYTKHSETRFTLSHK